MPETAARAKIVATLGPASNTPEKVAALIDAGADAFRLNFSHGTLEDHAARAAMVREVAGDRPIAIIADLQGPRIRMGKLAQAITLRDGDSVSLWAGEDAPAGALPTTYPRLADDLRPGARVLIDGGLLELAVEQIQGKLVRCRAVNGGPVSSNKGLNLPGTDVSEPTITDKDRVDAKVAAQVADYIAMSFVRSGQDVAELRAFLRGLGRDVPIISKIERGEAVERMDEVIAESDGIMVARGDLGVELPQEQVPGIQKRLIARANAAAKPVITATEMLQSMVDNPRPTRAEASDVANAIIDGTDAVMLSGETAAGKYPIEAVRVMNTIAHEAEKLRRELGRATRIDMNADIDAAVADAACSAARDVDARAIVALTMSGRTARFVAQRRPQADIIALTPNETTRRRLAIAWGVESFMFPVLDDPFALVRALSALYKERTGGKAGDVIVIIGGAGQIPGSTNLMKIHRVTS